MLPLHLLQGFVAVAEELHFGRAAARIHRTQSPLSRQVQMLEAALGVALLERTSRSVRLTPAGRAFLADAKRLISGAEAAAEGARRVARGEGGLLTLGYTAASALRPLPALVALCRARLPHLELRLEEAVTADQLDALARRRVDLGLVRPFDPRPGIARAPLLRERLILALPEAHELARQDAVGVEALHGRDFIAHAPAGGRYFDELLTGLFREAGIAPRVTQRVNQAHTILVLVGAGIGLALVPESARGLGVAGVALRPLLGDPVRAELLLAWREGEEDPALERLRALAMEAARA